MVEVLRITMDMEKLRKNIWDLSAIVIEGEEPDVMVGIDRVDQGSTFKFITANIDFGPDVIIMKQAIANHIEGMKDP